MKTIGLNNNIEKTDNLDGLLDGLEKKSKEGLDKFSSAYDIGENNEIYATLTRTSEIENKSLKFIDGLMFSVLEKNTNPKMKTILKKLKQIT